MDSCCHDDRIVTGRACCSNSTSAICRFVQKSIRRGAARPARLVRETMDDEFALFAAEIGQLEAAAKEKDAGDASPAEAPPPVPPLPRPPRPPPDRARPRADERPPGDDRQGAGGETHRSGPRNAPRSGCAAAAVASIPRPRGLGARRPAPGSYPGLGDGPQPPPRRVHRRRSPPGRREPPPPPTGTAGAAMASVKKVGAPVYRSAGGDRWVDKSLADWPENDHRIFVGARARGDGRASRARVRKVRPSFAMARVVMDKRTSKTPGTVSSPSSTPRTAPRR